jgi:hypothetical protein
MLIPFMFSKGKNFGALFKVAAQKHQEKEIQRDSEQIRETKENQVNSDII